MDAEKIGKFIKELRMKNNMTQKELADKYNVTFQAVSKWENGINLPDVSLIRQMSKDFNISVENILDGNYDNKQNNNKNKIILIIILAIVIIIGILLIFKFKDKKSFDFKTISATCDEFKVTGSMAYDKNKSSIYISQINYCGGDDNSIYESIECNLYETNGNKISSCKKSENNITLEEYLKEVEFKVDNYEQTCTNFDDDSLYLEIKAISHEHKNVIYKIPLDLSDNCHM